MANLTINGKTINVDVDDDTPLLWAIRENVGLTGTKYGCGIAQCGACTVHIDGVAMRSCGVLVSEAAGKQITTIEGLATNGALHKVQQAWVANDVPQCGYCQSGMPRLTGACYNTVAPGYAFSLSGVYQPKDGQFAEVEGATSPVNAPRELRQREAESAANWFKTVTVDSFG